MQFQNKFITSNCVFMIQILINLYVEVIDLCLFFDIDLKKSIIFNNKFKNSLIHLNL